MSCNFKCFSDKNAQTIWEPFQRASTSFLHCGYNYFLWLVSILKLIKKTYVVLLPTFSKLDIKFFIYLDKSIKDSLSFCLNKNTSHQLHQPNY